MLNTSELVIPVTRPDGTTYMAPRFEWDAAKEQVAMDVADGKYRTQEMADRAGVSTAAVYAWQKHPDFMARVDENVAICRERVRYLGVARVETRVAEMNDRWLGRIQLRRERAAAAKGLGIPGAETGLMVKQLKQIGGGENAQIVEEWVVDNATDKEQREIEKAAAMQLGQLVEKKELTGAAGGPIQMQAVLLAELMTPDELETLKRRAQEKAAGGSVVIDAVPEIAPAVSSNSEPEEFPA